MRKFIAPMVLLLTVSLTVSAQPQSKHKPSAAVQKRSHKTPTSTSTSAARPGVATTPKPETIDSSATSSTPPVKEPLPNNGPLYPDERGPLPAPALKSAAKTAGPTPSDLSAGTAIRMKLHSSLSSRSNCEGDAFGGVVTEPVVVRGTTVIPAGASISGHLLRVSDPRRITGTGSLRLRPESVTLPNGQSYAISASMVDTSTPKKLTVDDEGRIKARGFNGGDKTEMIAGTGAGAIAGTIIAGGKGTLFGSMIVGGATVVHWLTKRHPVDVPAGTELIMEINHPMTVSSTPLLAGK